MHHYPSELSGGEQQRVAVARALVQKPKVVLADEPTGNLDSRSSEIIMQELADIHRQGNTIIMVTHNPEIAFYADRLIKMVDGQIASDSLQVKPEIDEFAKRPLGVFERAVENAASAEADTPDQAEIPVNIQAEEKTLHIPERGFLTPPTLQEPDSDNQTLMANVKSEQATEVAE